LENLQSLSTSDTLKKCSDLSNYIYCGIRMATEDL
jgi:hypothetical protein